MSDETGLHQVTSRSPHPSASSAETTVTHVHYDVKIDEAHPVDGFHPSSVSHLCRSWKIIQCCTDKRNQTFTSSVFVSLLVFAHMNLVKLLILATELCVFFSLTNVALLWSTLCFAKTLMSWGKLLDLLSFSVFSIFSLWIGIVFLQETVDSIPCPQSY